MVSNSLLRGIGKQIAIARARLGHSQFTLNRSCELYEGKTVKDSHIAKLEKGELNITIETLELIAKKLNCTVEIKLRMNRKKTAPVEHEKTGQVFRVLNHTV